MMKRVIRRGLLGFLIGIAVQYIVAILVSLYLRLGYLLPYPASFPERFGGEMNTVLIVTAACGLLGMGIGAISAVLFKRKTKTGLAASRREAAQSFDKNAK